MDTPPDRTAADGAITTRLPFHAPLEWDTMLAYFASRAIPGVEHVSGGCYRRTIVVDGEPGLLELGPGGPDHLLLRVRLARPQGLVQVAERARRIFNLDADVAAARRHLGADPTLGALMTARPGLRQPGAWDPFEIGVRAIIGQQVSVAGATTVTGRVVARHGTAVPGLASLGLSHAFPTAETFVGADLDGLGLTGARINAIRAFAAAVVSNEVRLDGSVGLDELLRSIMAVRGLGPWTANYLALRLGEPDAFPAADIGLQRALAAPERPSTAALTAMAEAWRPWRSFAAIHLWMSGGSGQPIVTSGQSKPAAAATSLET
jgi:AraC family transcriptional regulator of adaptative response / DNA-3-methyladenine glycosylase II